MSEVVTLHGVRVSKRFMIFGRVIEVVMNPQLCSKEDYVGVAMHRQNRIELQPSTESNPVPSSKLEQTYLHEVVHILLRSIGYNKICDDEQFVDLFAHALHQFLSTAEYDEEPSELLPTFYEEVSDPHRLLIRNVEGKLLLPVEDGAFQDYKDTGEIRKLSFWEGLFRYYNMAVRCYIATNILSQPANIGGSATTYTPPSFNTV